MRQAFLGLIGAFALAACSGGDTARPQPDDATLRSVEQGELVGFRHSPGAWAWQGVPFAAAPEGDLRWRAPRPAPAYEARFEALDHPVPCPQFTSALQSSFGVPPGQLVGSEDCLRLDIYAPEGAHADNAARPVMVWIHGGANVWGFAGQYDGAQLARDQDVVVVVIQYRLGGLGFFAHEGLRADATDPRDAAANFALLDQIAALEWVRANIAQFGGDAGNVTIFGESAGGHNVAGLLASPLAAGLFHRAIIQSGSFDSVSWEAASGAEPGQSNDADSIATRIAGEGATPAALRAASLDAVFDAYRNEDGAPFLDLPRMIEDGVTIPRDGLANAFASTGTFNAVPVITGTNRDEMKLFNAFRDDLVNRYLGVIIVSRDTRFYNTIAEYQSRTWRILSVDQAASRMLSGGHRDVWAYRFDWDEAGRALFVMDLSHLLGAAHAMEIPFVFNHFNFFGRLDGVIFNDDNAAGRESLAAAMGAYWAEFARTGEPGTGGPTNLPRWERWNENGLLMRFDSPADNGQEIITGTDSFEAIEADLAADPRLDDVQRCRVVEAIAEWRPRGSLDAMRQRLGCA
ncbi:MAG: carboxylesterase/lipase family protein [Caulobacterales bacterium]|uniref:carboxylesterase/lipase family protein n=1 Tax=Glycocaulis sp. TaxID=1969725 RepID=UPI003FA0F3E8